MILNPCYVIMHRLFQGHEIVEKVFWDKARAKLFLEKVNNEVKSAYYAEKSYWIVEAPFDSIRFCDSDVNKLLEEHYSDEDKS